MSTQTLDIETLLPWGPPKDVDTKAGPRSLRKAAPTEAFWAAWRENKDALRAAGISCGRDQKTGDWIVCWWRVTEQIAKVVEQRQEALAASAATDADIDVPRPAGLEYLPFQRAGIKFVLDAFGRGENGVLVGDSPGLGKTIEAIGVINATKPKRVLIICPCNLRINWSRELAKWLVGDVSVAVAKTGCPFPRIADVIVVHYDVLHKFEKELRAIEWDLLIGDEIHFCKSATARRTRQVKGYKPKNSKNPEKAAKEQSMALSPIPAKRRIGMTGTPIVNRPVELWTILEWLNPARYNNFFKFALRYCAAQKVDIGRGRTAWDFTGSSHLDELRTNLRSTLLLRRLKADVLRELPPKRYQIIEVPNEMSAGAEDEWDAAEDRVAEASALVQLAAVSDDPKVYEEAVANLKTAQAAVFAELSEARHRLGLAKLPFVIEHLQNALEESDKIVVFAHHRDVVAALKNEFGAKAVVLQGGMGDEDKQASVDRFQTDPSIRLFIGQDDAAGVGYTLTASDHVVFAEGNWVPGNLSQAEDRCHRIGTKKSVLVQHLVFEKTLDARMIKTCVDKQQVIEQALDAALPPEAFEPVVPTGHVTVQVKELAAAPALPAEQVQAIHLGLQMIAGVCNGARTFDGAGFNKMDTRIGKSLAEQRNLSPRQAMLGLKLCVRYRKQLPEDVVNRAGAQKKGKNELES